MRGIMFTCAVVVAALVWGITSNYRAAMLARSTLIARERALYELSAYLDSIETGLQKGMYASTAPMLADLSSDVWRESTAAKTSLSSLPANQTELLNTYRFLSQVGDFTMTLNKHVADGGTITDSEAESLTSLYNYAKSVSDQVDYLLLEQQNGMLSFEDAGKLQTVGEAAGEALNFGSALTDLEQSLSDYPSLIYDGPFSDHISQRTPKLCEGKANITLSAAENIAAVLLGTDAAGLSDGGKEDSSLRCYIFSSTSRTVAVSEQGGYPCYMLCSDYAGETRLSPDEAINAAKAYLDSIGYTGMKETYFSSSDGICTINFAYMAGDAVCYTDLIKVGVSLADGTVLSFDARGYIMNHTERSQSTPSAYSPFEAQKNLSKNLTVKSVQPTVIPDKSGGENYAYEYTCTGTGGEDLLVYLDPMTGDELELLILLYSDGGILTK